VGVGKDGATNEGAQSSRRGHKGRLTEEKTEKIESSSRTGYCRTGRGGGTRDMADAAKKGTKKQKRPRVLTDVV